MLLDNIIPEYDFTEVHTIRIKANPEIIFHSIKDVTPAEISGIMHLLLFLRSLPEKAVGRDSKTMDVGEPVLSGMLRNGFTKLGEDAPREFVFGLIVPGKIGRVWHKSSGPGISIADAGEFLTFNQPDYLRVAANFLVMDEGERGFCTVRTESRTRALSAQSRRDFTPYWRIIRPFSGLIRRLWLRGIKNHAERRSQE